MLLKDMFNKQGLFVLDIHKVNVFSKQKPELV